MLYVAFNVHSLHKPFCKLQFHIWQYYVYTAINDGQDKYTMSAKFKEIGCEIFKKLYLIVYSCIDLLNCFKGLSIIFLQHSIIEQL